MVISAMQPMIQQFYVKIELVMIQQHNTLQHMQIVKIIHLIVNLMVWVALINQLPVQTKEEMYLNVHGF